MKQVKTLFCRSRVLLHFTRTSHMEYWPGDAKTKQTILLHKCALRIIFIITYNSHTEPLFKTVHILKSTDVHEIQNLIL